MAIVYLKKLDKADSKIAVKDTLSGIKWVPVDRLAGSHVERLVAFPYDQYNSESCIKGIVEWCRFQRSPFPRGEYGICQIDFGQNGAFKVGKSFFRFILKKPHLGLKKKYNTVWG